ncbi:uncharacterized protein LOC128955250 [Oppia nitens]|uniref:uncharacterized protein LOC128955250 n=1 Tax=Oppia nitens TaxID=1686743 RepID=UPI0023D9B465|nr:uncharacterized protein LOC128955250 [Oppia nitens]
MPSTVLSIIVTTIAIIGVKESSSSVSSSSSSSSVKQSDSHHLTMDAMNRYNGHRSTAYRSSIVQNYVCNDMRETHMQMDRIIDFLNITKWEVEWDRKSDGYYRPKLNTKFFCYRKDFWCATYFHFSRNCNISKNFTDEIVREFDWDRQDFNSKYGVDLTDQFCNELNDKLHYADPMFQQWLYCSIDEVLARISGTYTGTDAPDKQPLSLPPSPRPPLPVQQSGAYHMKDSRVVVIILIILWESPT